MITREFAFLCPLGQTICPQCCGGTSHEKSCNIWDDNVYRHVKCHRASCGVYARYPLLGYYGKENASPAPSQEVLRPYAGDRFPLALGHEARLRARFGFYPHTVERVGYTTELEREPFLIPILAPTGQERGIVEAVFGQFKRRRIWKAKHEPMISWTPEGDNWGTWLVEDQISALKLWDTASIRACALLGTSLNIQSVAEIQRNTIGPLTIALDADATAEAFMLARKWGAAFDMCRVQILTRDIKDMTVKDILEMIANAGYGPISRSPSGPFRMGQDS